MAQRDEVTTDVCPRCREYRELCQCDPLVEWAAELHRQLEKIWYTPKGVAYSDDEAQKVIDVLGPTDDAVPTWGPAERAKFWKDHHG